jgi:hypothetical protein
MDESLITPDRITCDLFGNVKKANNGDKNALTSLRKELAGPNGKAILDVCGDLALQAEESLLVAILGQQEGAKTCVRAKMRQMRAELGWSESSALERILIERVVATWLDVYFAELVCNQSKGDSIHQLKYKQHRIDRSHKRHLSAVKMLATVRKMALPVLVDIKAEVNVTHGNHLNQRSH